MANRLAQSLSPYLQQHADNPVDWWEWGDDAFEEARRRDVPVILSVGYAACHWCHVMAHESFEDERTAALMNEGFVSVKVDREERPDVDAVYMAAVQAMTGQGGWPMTVVLTPDREPFFAGTYFPPTPRHGLPSFTEVLSALSQVWTDERERVLAAAQEAVDRLSEPDPLRAPGAPPTAEELSRSMAVLSTQFDPQHAGFGGAPKFPPSMTLEHLLRHHARTGDAGALEMAERTMDEMARGGIYDQLGGGFARYAVDRAWVVPHFEKMLYDNALLLRAYAHWWRATGSPLARRVVEETATFLLRDLRTPEGGFASALDADSEGEEGRFYVWTRDQLDAVLGADDGAWAAALLSVTTDGSFEGDRSVLRLLVEPDDAARWRRVRSALFDARAERVPPMRDDKVVAAWNGWVIAGLAEAGALLDRPEWVEAAAAAADLLLAVHLGGGEHADRLVRVSRDGRPGRHAGLLEDHAAVAEGLLALYSVSGDDVWLSFAGVLLDVVLAHYRDDDGGLVDVADDAEPLLVTPADPTDNATPSGRSSAAAALLAYAALTGSAPHRDAAEKSLGAAARLATTSPRFAGWALAAAEALVDGPMEVAVVGDWDAPATAELRRAALHGTRPGLVLALGEPDTVTGVGLLVDRPLLDGVPTAYVCRGFVCQAPTTDPALLAEQTGDRGWRAAD